MAHSIICSRSRAWRIPIPGLLALRMNVDGCIFGAKPGLLHVDAWVLGRAKSLRADHITAGRPGSGSP
jgi:hypothetical protein